MIEVFKTNVQELSQVNYLTTALVKEFPRYSVNFDLEDCDKIIRLQAQNINVEKVISFMNKNSFTCEMLPD